MHESSPTRRRVARGALAVAVLAAVLTGSAVSQQASASIPSSPDGATSFVPITPCRLLDTRPGSINVGQRATPLGAGETHSVVATGESGSCHIPTDATALSMNVVAIGATASSYLTVFPEGVTRPTSSSLNWVAGQAPTPNAVTSALGAGGGLSLFNLTGTVDLAVDVVGYFVAAGPSPIGATGPAGATGAPGPQGASSVLPRIVTVATSGGQFTSLGAALASITDASPTNRYLIRIGPGVYDDSSPATLQDDVDIEGAGRGRTVLRSSSILGTVIAQGVRATVSDLTIENTSGFAINAFNGNVVDTLRLRDVTFVVSGTPMVAGVWLTGLVEGDGVEVVMSGVSYYQALLIVGTARMTDLTVRVSGGDCVAVTVSGNVWLSDFHVEGSGCQVATGITAASTNLVVDDATIDLGEVLGGGVALESEDTVLTSRGLTVRVTGPSTNRGVKIVSGTAFLTDADIQVDDIALDNAGDVMLTDSVVVGSSTGMSGRCAQVRNVDFTTYVCD